MDRNEEELSGKLSPYEKWSDLEVVSGVIVDEDSTTGNTAPTTRLDHALSYQRRGWSVIPLKGKKPRGSWGEFQEQAADEKQIRDWWPKGSKVNIGIVTGKASGFVVLDIDGDEGEESLRRAGIVPNDTVTSITGGGGRHMFYRMPEGGMGNKVGILEHVDVRGDGGQVVAPPSIHPETKIPYRWAKGKSPDDIEIAHASEAVLKMMRTKQEESGPSPHAMTKGHAIPEGQRDNALFRYALELLRKGLKEPEAVGLVLVRANSCQPPFPPEEAKEKVKSALKYINETEYQCKITDTGNAKRLAIRHGENLRYCHPMKKWLIWDGSRWAEDHKGGIVERAKETVGSMLQQASSIEDSEKRRELTKQVIRYEAGSRISAMIDLARSVEGIAILPSQLNLDPWKLNVLNGTIDLKTGELLAHDRNDLITMLAPVEYDPEADSTMLDGFLERVLPDPEVRGFVQQAAGYSAYGGTDEEILLFAYGPPATGKSTLLRAITTTLGDYAATADFDTFLKRKATGGPRNDIARLAGKRFVVSLEVDEGSTLAESLVNQLTGSDVVAARELYRETFEFRPQFTIWLAANNRPKIDGTEGGIWRRIREVPFDQRISEGERDPNLKKDLSDPEKQGSAVLNWLVQGCLSWQREGLGVPKAVKEATSEYREEMDQTREFMDDCLVTREGHQLNNGLMHSVYEKWCKSAGHTALSQRKLTISLKDKGLVQKDGHSRRYWENVALADSTDSSIELTRMMVHGRQVYPCLN